MSYFKKIVEVFSILLEYCKTHFQIFLILINTYNYNSITVGDGIFSTVPESYERPTQKKHAL